MRLDLPASVDWFFFDLDGTLWNHASASADVVKGMMSPRLRAQPDDVLLAFREISREVLAEFDAGLIDIATSRISRFERLYRRFGFDPHEHRAAAAAEEYLDAYCAYRGLYEGAAEVVIAAAKIARVGIVTNAAHRTQDPKVGQLPDPSIVEFILTTDETACLKPAPKFFDMAEQRAGHPPRERIVMIGDEWRSDIEPALARGYTPVWIGGDDELPDPRANVLHIDKISDLLPILHARAQ